MDTTNASTDGGGRAAESADANTGDDEWAYACLLERAEWRCCRRLYVSAARGGRAPLALIETWRKT